MMVMMVCIVVVFVCDANEALQLRIGTVIRDIYGMVKDTYEKCGIAFYLLNCVKYIDKICYFRQRLAIKKMHLD